MLTVNTVATFKWTPMPGYRSEFTAAAVNTLKAMTDRHYRSPHEFVCVTDDARGLDPSIRVVPLWQDHATVPAPQGGKNPSCYRRLKVFSREIEAVLGKRFVVMDLDMLITGDLAPLWDRPEDFVMTGDTNPKTHYNGSMILLTAGTRAKVWETFDPLTSPRLAAKAGHYGSDQAWISYCLGKGEAIWTRTEGVYSFRNHLALHRNRLPHGTKVVNFHGLRKMWSPNVSHIPWIQEHYR